MVLVIRGAISLIISMIDIMHVGRTIRGLNSLTSSKLCHVLGLDESTLWNLFGLFWMSWSGRLAFLLPSSLSLGRGETAAGGGYAVDVDWGRQYTIGSRPHEVKNQERSNKEQN